MCVRLMLPGEKSVVTCPPDFAYDKFPRLYILITIIRIHFYILLLTIVCHRKLSEYMVTTGQQMFLKELMFSGRLNYLDLNCLR
jgi:hypothetical protein